MSELQLPLMSEKLGSGSQGDPAPVQPEVTVYPQPSTADQFIKIVNELKPYPFTAKDLKSNVICSCSCRLGVIVGLEDGSIVLVGLDAEVQVLGKHEEGVKCLCAVGDLVVSGSKDRTVRIWSLEGRSQIAVLEGHSKSVNCVSISSDEKHVVSGSVDKTLRIWDAEEKKLLAVLEDHTDIVNCVTISRDGKLIISGSDDKTVRIWDLEGRKQLAVLEGHTSKVLCISISSDGKHIASGALYPDKMVRIWDVKGKKLLAVLQGHSGSIACVSICSNDKRIISGSRDNALRIWDLEGRRQLAVLGVHSDSVTCMSISPDGKHIVSGSDDNSVIIWDLEEGKLVTVLEGHSDRINCASFSSNGKLIVSGSRDKSVRILSFTDTTSVKVLEGHSGIVRAVAITPDGKRIVSGAKDNTLRVWDFEGKTQLAVLEGHSGFIFAVSITPDGKYAVSGSADKTVRIWSLEATKELAVLKGHSDDVKCVSISPNGKYIVSGSFDRTVRIWSFETTKILAVLEGHAYSVSCVSISSSGQYIVSGSMDKTIRIWDFEERKLLAVLENTGAVLCLSISADGKQIVSGALDYVMRIWSFEERKQLGILEGHTLDICSISISPDGMYIVSGSRDASVRVWDIEQRKLVSVLAEHDDEVNCVAITPDGKHVAYGLDDKTIRIVDLAMAVPSLRADFLRDTFDSKEPPPSKSYYCCGKYLKQGIPMASSVVSSPILPHYFNGLHICAYYNQFNALRDYLEQGVPIIRGVFGSPLTIALMNNSTKCINVILQYLISQFAKKQGFLAIQEIVEDFQKLLATKAASLVPFFSTLLSTPTQSLPDFIVPLSELPFTLFQVPQWINLPDFAQFEGNELLTQNGEIVQFLISRFHWNFAKGSAQSLEFLRALEDCGDTHILTTPLVDSLVQSKWKELLLLTWTHTLLYLCLLLCLVCLTFNNWRPDVLSLVFVFLNALFLLYEVMQSFANGTDYWIDPWNYVDLIRGLSGIIWGYLMFLELKDLHYLHFLVVSVCFLRGFTFFRTFKMTRMFVRMVIEVVKETHAFLVILAYSTVSFGMMYAVLMPEEITSASEAWTNAYELLMGTHDETDFDLLKWLCFTAASLVNVIIMLNLLISILGDAYGKAQESANENDNLEMLKLVIEYESMFFWRRKIGKPSAMVVCKSAEDLDTEDKWTDRVNNIKKAMEVSLTSMEEKLEGKLEKKLTAMEERLQTAMEVKIDQVLAALQAQR